MKSWPFKDPDEVEDFEIRWWPRLEGDTIAGSTWVVSPGITRTSASRSSDATVVWLAGGTPGQVYSVSNMITTALGRTMKQTVRLKVKEK